MRRATRELANLDIYRSTDEMTSIWKRRSMGLEHRPHQLFKTWSRTCPTTVWRKLWLRRRAMILQKVDRVSGPLCGSLSTSIIVRIRQCLERILHDVFCAWSPATSIFSKITSRLSTALSRLRPGLSIERVDTNRTTAVGQINEGDAIASLGGVSLRTASTISRWGFYTNSPSISTCHGNHCSSSEDVADSIA